MHWPPTRLPELRRTARPEDGLSNLNWSEVPQAGQVQFSGEGGSSPKATQSGQLRVERMDLVLTLPHACVRTNR